jgi:hypothetical protein
MKQIICFMALLLCPLPFIGVYQTRWIEDDQTVFFVKKQPTYKLHFINVFRSDHEDNWKGHLEKTERQYATDFCQYYVGYKTAISSMDDFYRCKELYESSIAKDPPSYIQHESWDIPD